MKPWVVGPFELFLHAETHLKEAGDADKRMALVGFDNVVETSVQTFLELHPAQRNNLDLDRGKVQTWKTNFHTKLDFLEWLCEKRSAASGTPKDEMIWYHNLRNSLYHAGNGFVPALRHIQGARSAAKWVIEFLFGIDVEAELQNELESTDQRPPTPPQGPSAVEEPSSADRQVRLMDLVEIARDSLATYLLRQGIPVKSKDSLRQLLLVASDRSPGLPVQIIEASKGAIGVRNMIAHGGRPATTADVEEAIQSIQELIKISELQEASFEMLPQLQRKYPGWIREQLLAARIVKRANSVYLELTERIGVGDLLDESVKRTDLSFIGDGPPDDSLYFPPSMSPDELARRFIDDFDSFSIYHCTDLFNEVGADGAQREHFLKKSVPDQS